MEHVVQICLFNVTVEGMETRVGPDVLSSIYIILSLILSSPLELINLADEQRHIFP